MKFKKEISAGGIVFKKENGQIVWLVTQHSQHKGWSFPKGIIGDEKENEPPQEAAIREVGEEGGIQAQIVNNDPVDINYKYKHEEYLVDKTVYYFLMEYLSGDPKDHDWEVSEAKFLPQDEVTKILTFENDKKAFEKALEKFKN